MADEHLHSAANDNAVRKIDLDGNVIWTFQPGSDVYDMMAVVVDDEGFVYCCNSLGYAYKVDPQGQQVWEFQDIIGVEAQAIYVDHNGFVYVGVTGSFDDRLIYKVTPEGAKVWEYDLSTSVASGFVVDSDDFVYVTHDNRVSKFSSDGNNLWTVGASGTGNVGHPDIVMDGAQRLYIGNAENGIALCSREDGTIEPFYDAPSTVHSVAVDHTPSIYCAIAGLPGRVAKVTEAGDEVWLAAPHDNATRAVAVDSGLNVYSGSEVSEAAIKKLDSEGIELWSITPHGGNTINALAVTPVEPPPDIPSEFWTGFDGSQEIRRA